MEEIGPRTFLYLTKHAKTRMRQMGLKARDLQAVCSTAEVIYVSPRPGEGHEDDEPMYRYTGEDIVVVLADKEQGPTVVTVLPRTYEQYERPS